MKALVMTACVVLTLLGSASSAQCQEYDNSEAARARLGELAEDARKKIAPLSFEDFRAQTLYLEETGKYYVNGDVPILNEKLLREFWEQNVQDMPDPDDSEFTILSVGGLDQVWDSSKKMNLTYCVSTTFGSRHPVVVAAMQVATEAWEAVAALDFVYLSAEDGVCNVANDRLLFDVRPVNADGRFLAAAFFPNDPRPARSLVIDPSSFGLDPNGRLSLVGILRHELGHVLGARHEHTRPEAGICFEDEDWRGVTDYDALSVMHYPQCNGLGDWSLRLTANDQSGVACIYGAAEGFTIDGNVCTPEGGLSAVETQTVGPLEIAADETRTIGTFPVAIGTLFRAEMTGDGTQPGDPDLYVKFDGSANLANYDCRPFLIGAEETCEFTVPPGKSMVSIAVHGFTAGRASVAVTLTVP